MAGEYDSYLDAAAALPQTERDYIAHILLDPTGQLRQQAFGNYGLEYANLIGGAWQSGQNDPNYWAGTALAPQPPPNVASPIGDPSLPGASQPFDAAAKGEFRNLLDLVNVPADDLQQQMSQWGIAPQTKGEAYGWFQNTFGLDPNQLLHPQAQIQPAAPDPGFVTPISYAPSGEPQSPYGQPGYGPWGGPNPYGNLYDSPIYNPQLYAPLPPWQQSPFDVSPPPAPVPEPPAGNDPYGPYYLDPLSAPIESASAPSPGGSSQG
jgi:hypothetical protein